MDSMRHENAVEEIQGRMRELYSEAMAMVERHRDMVRSEEEARRGWENKSNLMLTCNLRGNSLRIEWMTYRWYGKKGARNLWRETIKKQKGEDAYNLDKLLAQAKDWEKPLVEEIEPKLAKIRHEARLLNKAMMYLRHAKNAAHGKPHQNGVDEEDDME